MMSDSLLPVILSSPNDPTIVLSWIEPRLVVTLFASDIRESFIEIPGPVVGVCDDDEDDDRSNPLNPVLELLHN